MNILVCPNTLTVGGASLVAADSAAAMQQRGHRVLVFGPPGPLVERLQAMGIKWIESPPSDDGSGPVGARPKRTWPSPTFIRLIRRVVATENIDVVHTYEWVRCLEAHFGAHMIDGVPLVSSILHIHAPRFLPQSAHIVVGTKQLADLVRSRGFPAVTLIEPCLEDLPTVDGDDGAAFASTYELDDRYPTVVMASRLAAEKLESLHLAIEAVEMVDRERPVQFVIAGEGWGQQELMTRADGVNERLGRRAVVFTGLLDDVGPAYAGADLVVGMGTAVLGGMAHGKPAIVVGLEGFSELLTSETAGMLSDVGFWGVGPLEGAAARLAGHIAEALRDPARAAELASVSRSVVSQRPTKDGTASMLEVVYRQTIAASPAAPKRLMAASRSLGLFAGMRARWWLHRRLIQPFRSKRSPASAS